MKKFANSKKSCIFVGQLKTIKMKYFKIATAQVRPLQYKNCYDWAMVCFDEATGNCYYRVQNKLNVAPLSEVISRHKKAVSQKPYGIKTVQFAEFYGIELAVIDWAAQTQQQEQIITDALYYEIRLTEKKWMGYNLKNVNDLSFLK